jgi:hypothetical protein
MIAPRDSRVSECLVRFLEEEQLNMNNNEMETLEFYCNGFESHNLKIHK